MAYYCNNDSCDRKGIKESRAKFVLEEGKLISRCAKCNSIKVSDSAPKKFGVPMFSAISLMTDQQKKDLLMKRSDDDFKKNGEKYDKYMQDKEAVRRR